MKGVYTANIKISAIDSARTLLYITATSSKVVEVLSTEVTNASNETNEQCEAVWQKITTLGTPTATTITPAKHEDGDQAATSTVKGNVTASEPTYGANTEIGYAGFPSLIGYRYPSVDGEVEPFAIPPSGSYGLRLLNTPAAFDCVVRVTFRERG